MDVERATLVGSSMVIGFILAVLLPGLSISWIELDIPQSTAIFLGVSVGAFAVYAIPTLFSQSCAGATEGTGYHDTRRSKKAIRRNQNIPSENPPGIVDAALQESFTMKQGQTSQIIQADNELLKLQETGKEILRRIENAEEELNRKYRILSDNFDQFEQFLNQRPYGTPPPPSPPPPADAPPAWRHAAQEKIPLSEGLGREGLFGRRSPFPIESRMPPRGEQIFKSTAENLPFLNGDASDA
ncbi:hypothetical protein SISSUDRAFT_1127312 [Sistotremastrum suecicum HHB10207 ss-3]|uniref:Uncharacterized protein n=1 Tax=Sistotremastrum suecicum HHB10207 ss-3 TaxID=1314776 RepID=A0A166F9N4_9AGAM|nr:hypothetical protein SISSUDRAFT_1127312 [Sistotremastrum suecicum HHB10207 ss-3]